MRETMHRHTAIALAALILSGCTGLPELRRESIDDFRLAVLTHSVEFPVPPGGRVDTVVADSAGKTLTVKLSREFSAEPFRPASVRAIYAGAGKYLTENFEGYSVSVEAQRRPIETLIPNIYRDDPATIDTLRLPRRDRPRPTPLVENLSRPFAPARGLKDKYIVLWHSHGWYYNIKEDRWEWQRPRLFQTAEDLVPLSFTLPYLIPMLEGAGATVFVPRERDCQIHEVVVDNDSRTADYVENSLRTSSPWHTGEGPGFAAGTPPYPVNHNPFLDGTHRVIPADTTTSATATWIPDIPETGEYGVSVSYRASPEHVGDAQYAVYHAGGKTLFRVNQQIGGGTWIRLGTFRFEKGRNPAIGRVVLMNGSASPGKLVSADAVRFGGGMGVVERNGRTSGRAKYLEAARYFLQYAGMPDTLVYNLNSTGNDYNDDYQSRAEYANYLRGSPSGPNRDRSSPGLGIPVDLTLAFHTDAGITRNDTVIGTLSIFSTEGSDSLDRFPDGVSRLASRDFADILQTQIVDDLRADFDPAWRRRQLLDSRYSEAYRPNMPGALLELLSHQNFLDMKFMLDPRFRFTVSRAIYKAILRFLSFQDGQTPVVLPLPPRAFSTELAGDDVQLRWEPTVDPREKSADPLRYIVYTRVGDGGFDNGQSAEGTSLLVRGIRPGLIYSFKVTAVNDGGESFPSEVLSVCRMPTDKPTVMIVNGFDRISGPAWIETPQFSGFLNILDAGVPDHSQLNFTGLQHDFLPTSPWLTNDAPGHGASFADREGSIIIGNTFDFPAVHGRSLQRHGFSFASASRAAVMERKLDLRPYPLVDLILGKQRTTPWPKPAMDSLKGRHFAALPPPLREAITEYLGAGGRLLLSGAYIASDPSGEGRQDSTAIRFLRERLHYTLVTDHAARTGKVTPVLDGFFPPEEFVAFQPEGTTTVYGVESADALSPVNGGQLLFRYAENGFSAGTGFRGEYSVVALGFPLEAIPADETRAGIMGGILRYLLP
jgi:hypothetical protein